jgi:3-oxoacyl-[acyl-carrier protein] reductase
MANTPKSFLVTGATGGIGQAVSHRLAAAGHSLVLTARDANRLQELRSALPAGDGLHSSIPVDMASDESVAAFAEELTATQISLDGLVLMPPQPHSTNDPLPPNQAWRDIFQVSFVGPLALLKAAIATMKPDPAHGRRCKIVIISGMSSVQVLGHYATSNVIRCAWVGEAKTLAFALGERGIHINTLSLGGTLSPWYKAGLERRAAQAGVTYEERLDEETSNIPLRKYGTPEEVAVAVEGLLSPFSDHITGVNILHDGGFTRAY